MSFPTYNCREMTKGMGGGRSGSVRGGGWGGGGQFEYICMKSSANYISAKASIQVSAQ